VTGVPANLGVPPATPLDLHARLAATSPAARPRVLVERLLQLLRDELGIEGDELHPRSRFETLGVDSKRALELKELLDEELHCVLRTTLLFDYPTPESLAAHVIGVVFGDADADAAPAAPVTGAPARADGPDAGSPGSPESPESPEERLRRKLASYDI
jgi:acyl carrier protein